MSVFLALPLLAATGLYNPQVMHHGHCIAAPGSVDALYCQAPGPAALPHRYRHATGLLPSLPGAVSLAGQKGRGGQTAA